MVAPWFFFSIWKSKLCIITLKSFRQVFLNARLNQHQNHTCTFNMSKPSQSQPDFARRAFRFPAPYTWNALPKTVRNSDSLGTFKSRLKTFLFCRAYNWQWHDLPPAPLKSQPYSAIEIWIVLLLLSTGTLLNHQSNSNNSLHQMKQLYPSSSVLFCVTACCWFWLSFVAFNYNCNKAHYYRYHFLQKNWKKII